MKFLFLIFAIILWAPAGFSIESINFFNRFQAKSKPSIQIDFESVIDRDKNGNVKGSEHEMEAEISFRLFNKNRILFVNNAILENEYGEKAIRENKSIEIGDMHRFKINKKNRVELRLMGVHFTSDEYREKNNTNLAAYFQIDYRWRPFKSFTLVLRPRSYKYFEKKYNDGDSQTEEYRFDFSPRIRVLDRVVLNLLLRGKTSIERDKSGEKEIKDKVDFMPSIRWSFSKNLRFELFAKTRMMDSYDNQIISEDFFLYPLYGSEVRIRF